MAQRFAQSVTARQADASLTLNGLWIDGSLSVQGQGALGLTIQHCTFKPPHAHGNPPAASFNLWTEAGQHQELEVRIAHSIMGPLRLPAEMKALHVSDSIIDGVAGPAVAAFDPSEYGPPTTLERTTVLGQ